ncbi:MAG: polysaccharide deacetylase family protein, partial [Firmicutes bacterium]|nr:polysaccharide deacetylase family protein [Bacillota bacterium]
MKKAIIPILCAVMLIGGCSNSAETMNGEESVPYEQLSGEGTGWGFVRKKGAAPEIPSAQKALFSKYDCYYMDENSPKTLYLTFDEGYENGYTSKILDVLDETGTPAAFFVTGPYLENQTELVQRMIDDGHILGNHTVNHLNLPEQSVETVQSELSELNKTCEEMYGVTMKYMRPPEGEYSERVLSAAKDMGYKTI